ncbi:hypothetical protein J2W36_001392 [Variovorax ginsengisoli]|uniref:Uncharacterized protein n=1 Tax=Variovorax ginsengisoli TaxID=363844 RepID=A0ABT9S745_9BURK|nr:hypothetical protein [Variovorax ginsengisoli]
MRPTSPASPSDAPVPLPVEPDFPAGEIPGAPREGEHNEEVEPGLDENTAGFLKSTRV